MENMTIRLEARKRAVPLRLLAEELNISPATMYRRLSKKMSKTDRERYMTAIRSVSEQRSTTT